jgi:predicted nuclease of restriction endonuclease-like RecB superfamily
MLTADLAQSWQRGGRTGPRYIDPRDPDYLQDAENLINLFASHCGRARRELEETLQEYIGVGTDYKILRGLIKLLMDRCAFEISSSIEPSAIRRAVFLKACEHHPVIGEARVETLQSVARELDCAPETLLAGLYADLPENQKLSEFESLEASALLDLYNVAQAQALLYRCVEMYLQIEPQTPEGYRELFDAIKAYRLIHTVKGNSAVGYEIRLDGPVSMFHRSQKYGVQMAVFLPALLLCTGWQMRAEIAQKPGAAKARFEMDSRQTDLRSHYSPTMPYRNPSVEQLAESWKNYDSHWELEAGSAVIDLGESAFIPDYVLRRADGKIFYLEILGFWTPRHLQQRLEEFAHARIKNFIIAAWDELRGSRDPLARVPDHVLVFKRKLDPAAIELIANQLLSDSTEDGRAQ